MENKKDPMERIILEDFQMEAEMIKKEVQAANVGEMPPEIKDKIKNRLHEQIAEREKEKLYAKLSEEDRKALELGREMMKKQEAEKAEEKVVYFKKPKKMYLALATVVVLVLAMGVTSVGGPKRVVEMIQVMMGGRENVRVDTDEDNLVVENENEENAYQEIRDMFGIEPVRIFHQLDKMEFITSEIDEELQTAFLIYDCKGKNVNYYISTPYTNSSWGIDTEDRVINEYHIDHEKKGKIEIIEYESEPSKIRSFSVKYTHKGLEYYLTSAMDRSDFEELVKNLKFF